VISIGYARTVALCGLLFCIKMSYFHSFKLAEMAKGWFLQNIGKFQMLFHKQPDYCGTSQSSEDQNTGCLVTDQSRMSNSSKRSNCYGPRAFGGSTVLCDNFFLYCMQGWTSEFRCPRQTLRKRPYILHIYTFHIVIFFLIF